uniref:Ig-like domain-containing protein n=1 Tax=Poecilia formosa TaxID=48698 RepID=A0A087Y0W9_POEFO
MDLPLCAGCAICLLLGNLSQVFAVENPSCVIQDGGVKRAEPGGAVSLNCSCRDATVSFLFWYKQSPGGKPRVISTRMRHSPKADVRPAFQGRFQVAAQIQDGVNNLMITNLQPEDSGTYYCGVLEFGTTEFGQGVFLHVRNNNMNPSAHQLALKSVGLGESVNLTCDVFPERCMGEQRLCWFRDDASQRAVWCSSDVRCVRSTDENPLRTRCTSNLELKSVTSSDVGTYYCTLTSCGSTVSGDKTVVQIVGKATKKHCILTHCIFFNLVTRTYLGLICVCIVTKCEKRDCICQLSVNLLSNLIFIYHIQRGDVDDLHYAALSLKRSDERHIQEDEQVNICVYSSVKSKKK